MDLALREESRALGNRAAGSVELEYRDIVAANVETEGGEDWGLAGLLDLFGIQGVASGAFWT